LVCFVYLVHLVSFVQPKNETNETDQTDSHPKIQEKGMLKRLVLALATGVLGVEVHHLPRDRMFDTAIPGDWRPWGLGTKLHHNGAIRRQRRLR
jgi:hypothetical protein